MTNLIKYLSYILLAVVLAAGIFIYNPGSANTAADTSDSPCRQPLSFHVGEIDSRFGIQRQEVLEQASEAARLWSDAAGQPVIQHAKNGNITVNFVYDERQQHTDAERRFRERIRSNQIQLDQLKAEHERRREKFDQRTEEYRELAKQTSAELNALNNWISEKNESGGFTEKELEQFEQRKREVEQIQGRIKQEEEQLAGMAKNINDEMERLNQRFEENNRLIDQYNERFAGDMRFTKATYQKTTTGGFITVNQFTSKQELVLILAHEMGHALDLGHHSSPASIMHNRMGEQDIYPIVQATNDDRQAVQALCN